MNRRQFLATGVGGALSAPKWVRRSAGGTQQEAARSEDVRSLFPRLGDEVFLNAAAGTPLSTFTERGLRRYEEFWRLGPGEERGARAAAEQDEVRAAFARLIGARPSEIAFVHCTKAGEQVVLDGLPELRRGGNVVTNDLHFTGSLHNLIGLRRSGVDVRIVRGRDWDVDLADMRAAIDEETTLVSVTLVSNVNGRVEPLPELARIAHENGAYVYADIIQAAGIVPIDVEAMGVDFAACSGYKWLYGPHGVGFLYVREELQGTALEDRLFPGYARPNYPPWVAAADPDGEDFSYRAPVDARRYQPGHVSYLGYSALHESLAFIERIGVERALRHSLGLVARLRAGLDPKRYECITPADSRSPIVTFLAREPEGLRARLSEAGITIAFAGDRRLRVSPALYNHEADVDRLIDVLHG